MFLVHFSPSVQHKASMRDVGRRRGQPVWPGHSADGLNVLTAVNSRPCVLTLSLCVSLPAKGGFVLKFPSERRCRQTTECLHCATKWARTKWEWIQGEEKETEGGRRGTDAIVCSLILLMVLKALAGEQMLFCEMDSIFFLQTWFSPSSRGHKVLLQNENNWWGHQFGLNVRLETQISGSEDGLHQLSLYIAFMHAGCVYRRRSVEPFVPVHLTASTEAMLSTENLPGTQTRGERNKINTCTMYCNPGLLKTPKTICVTLVMNNLLLEEAHRFRYESMQ